jgi:hypothetical protein
MGEANARGAERAIDRDRWGKGEKGDLKAKCPGGCKREFRIHPAMGVARVGNSADQYFIGAEKESDDTPTTFFTLNVADPSKMPASAPVHRGDNIYKDAKTITTAKGQVRRQAARFYIYEYREVNDAAGGKKWVWVREVTTAEAEIKWTVKLANKKGNFFKFHGPDMSSGNRAAPTIEPPEQSITVKRNFDPSKDAMKTRTMRAGSGRFDDKGEEMAYLGEILHDEKGHLLVLGGRGKAGSRTSAGGSVAPIGNYANNTDWVDDVSDGWIEAEIKFPDEPKPIKTGDSNGDAWVLVGPPDFGPQLTNVTSLYDTLIDVFVRTKHAPKGANDKVVYVMHGIEDRVKGTFVPYFDHDLRRLFEATVQTATVFKPANPQMKHPAVQRLAESTHKDDVKETPEDDKAGLAPHAHLRYKIFNTLRPPWQARLRDPEEPSFRHASEKSFPGVATTPDANVIPPPVKPAKADAGANDKELERYQRWRWSMPMLWGDNSTDYNSVRCTVTETQYKLVRAWWEGTFKESAADDFDRIPRSSAITPGGLDRAALERSVGAPFWPGIEVSWLCRCPDVYIEPLRVKRGLSAKPFKVEVDQPGGKFTAFEPTGFPASIPVDAGFFSQQMAQPWQADFLACLRDQPSTPLPSAAPLASSAFKIGWWPAQRPDDVIRGEVKPLDPAALHASTPVSAAPTTHVEADLEKTGRDEIKLHARSVTFTVGGAHPEQAPLKVSVKGKDEKGNDKDDTGAPYGETIDLPRIARSTRTDKIYSAVTEVKYTAGEAPKTTAATVAIGFGAAGAGNPADEFGLEGSTRAQVAPRTVTAAELKPSGVAALLKTPRHVTFNVGGTEPAESPMTATVTGTDKAGATQSETVVLDFLLFTATPTTSLYASVTSILFSAARPKLKATLDATVSIGIGTFMGNMEQWSAGISGFVDNTVNWWRLGFVVGGTETERDPTLPTEASKP